MCFVFSECKPSCTSNTFCTECLPVLTKQMFNMLFNPITALAIRFVAHMYNKMISGL